MSAGVQAMAVFLCSYSAAQSIDRNGCWSLLCSVEWVLDRRVCSKFSTKVEIEFWSWDRISVGVPTALKIESRVFLSAARSNSEILYDVKCLGPSGLAFAPVDSQLPLFWCEPRQNFVELRVRPPPSYCSRAKAALIELGH